MQNGGYTVIIMARLKTRMVLVSGCVGVNLMKVSH